MDGTEETLEEMMIRLSKETEKKQQENIKIINDDIIEVCREGIEALKNALETIAKEYEKEKKNKKSNFDDSIFLDLCFQLGVDPTVVQLPAFANIFGNKDKTYYNNVVVQIIDVCVKTRPINQGIIDMNDLLDRVNSQRFGNDIDMKTLKFALEKVKDIAPYFLVKNVNGQELLNSIPSVLQDNEWNILQIAQSNGGIISENQYSSFGDDQKEYFTELMKKGYIWVDRLDNQIQYYFPAFYLKAD